MEAQGH